jgi:hypothetical protein
MYIKLEQTQLFYFKYSVKIRHEHQVEHNDVTNLIPFHFHNHFIVS